MAAKMMEFKEKILYVRAQLNLSQTQLAEALHVSFQTVNRWERGKVHPTRKAELAFDMFCKDKGVTFEVYAK